MVVFAGDCTCRFFYRHILAFGMSAELFGEEADLRYSKSALRGYHRTWFVNPRSVIFPCTAHRIILHEEGVFPTCYKFDKSGIDAFKRFLCKRLRIPELKKIMGFPEDYVLIGTQADQKKFIGNAVEVNMARVLCEAICKEIIRKRKVV